MSHPMDPEATHTRRTAPQRCTLHVCTSCRPGGMPREPAERRPGYRLHRRLAGAVRASGLAERVQVVPVSCMSLCPRPCAIALSSPGHWSYLFGDQDPERTVEAVLTCVSRYLSEESGFLPRAARPEGLRESILGRIPPIEPVG